MLKTSHRGFTIKIGTTNGGRDYFYTVYRDDGSIFINDSYGEYESDKEAIQAAKDEIDEKLERPL